jgi:hypothetical protein
MLCVTLAIITVSACSQGYDPGLDTTAVPDFTVKAEIQNLDGSTLRFSEKPVRVQWGIGTSLPYNIAFVFPKNTK